MYIYHIFIYSSVDGHLVWFSILAVVNNIAVNIAVHVSFQVSVFFFFFLMYTQEQNCWVICHMVVLFLGFFFYFIFFSGLYLWHVEVPKLGVESEPQLLAYDTATATWDLSVFSSLRNLHTVFTVAAPVYIPTSSVQGFPFLHTLTNICYLCSF